MTIRFALPIVLVSGLAAQGPPQTPPRDARPPSEIQTGTAIIRGQITDKDTGLPIARATVRVRADGVTRERQTRSDADGRYAFTELGAGSYAVSAENPAELRATHLGRSFVPPGPMPQPSPAGRSPIVLKAGEIRNDINIALPRALAINGRVVNEFGDPLANVGVSAESIGRQGGGSFGSSRTTDDRGMFRLFGLMPGRYRVCADARGIFSPLSDFDAAQRDRPVRTCYPSTLREGDASPVVLTTSDSGEIEIVMQRGRTFTASGAVRDSTGSAARRPMVTVAKFDRGGMNSTSTTVDAGGQFTAKDLLPGDYAIRAEYGGGGRDPRDIRERELGAVTFQINGADIEGLVVTMTKGVRVVGHVAFEDEVPPASPQMIVREHRDRLAERMVSGPPASASVRDDLTFELSGLFGPQLLAVSGAPRGWIVKTIRYGGNDIMDVPTQFKDASDPQALEIVLSNRGAVVSGLVLEGSGKPSAGSRVVMFPVESARWRTPMSTPVSSSKDGSFTLSPYRAGDYLIVAVPSSSSVFDYGGPDQDGFAALSKVADRISLVENERRTIELRVVALPQR